MCEEMGVQLYEPALATSIMSDRGGTIVTKDYQQSAHKQAVSMQFIWACGHGDYLQHLHNTFWMEKISTLRKSQMLSPSWINESPILGFHIHQ